ncbi:MAG TPA: ATP-binding protein [Actinomadura sp.]|jgi:signal transduction histidine kinase|nr:ATP-binding protein [Actinomadura sp.]
MSEPLPPATRTERREARRHGGRSAHVVGGMEYLHLWISLLPAAVMALLGSAIVGFLLAADPSVSVTRGVLAVAVAGVALVLFAAACGAGAVTRRMHRGLEALRSLSARGQEDLQSLVEKVERGERPAPRDAESLSAEGGDLFALLARDLQWDQRVAQKAVLHVAKSTSGGEPDQRVEVFVNLARRMQSLVHREIQLLDDLEAQVEDPDLLKGLFTVDHLATRMRRQSESLAVIGGAASRRRWSRPVSMQEVLRAAIAEVEQYSRAKVVPPIDGTLHGNAVADVIHLVAELIENATKFSPPHTQVLVRAENVTAGLSIEVEDRGLGMSSADQRQMNGLLADPGRINISELLNDGRIGLYVVSALARRHGIRVQLQSNIYGGVQAVVVLPKGMIEAGSQDREPQRRTQPAHRGTTPAPAAQAPAAGRHASAPLAPALPPAEVPSPIAARGDGPGQSPAAGDEYAVAGRRPRLPERNPGPRPGERDPLQVPVRPTSTAPAADLSPRHPADHDVRPALPERRVQTHLAPELHAPPATRRDEPVADHIPGLMAAFQGGVNRAEDEESGPSGGN